MHARFSLARSPYHLRTWILVAIVLAALGLMAAIWDPHDLGDGLVVGSGGAVKAVWESAQGGVDDFLFGSPSARPAGGGR